LDNQPEASRVKYNDDNEWLLSKALAAFSFTLCLCMLYQLTSCSSSTVIYQGFNMAHQSVIRQKLTALVGAFVALAALLVMNDAAAQIYRCDNNGVIDYNNNVVSAKNKSCTVASLPNITTVPAPAAPKAAVSTGNSGTSAQKSATSTSSPNGFPKVDSGTQKARDNDRAAILDEERRKENSKLQELKKEFNNGEPERRGDERNYQKYLDRVEKMKEDIQRSENNLKSLERELQGTKG
jgi:hypothetical protein